MDAPPPDGPATESATTDNPATDNDTSAGTDAPVVTEYARRAASFGAAATAYAQHRPDYPVAAIRWALEPVVLARTSPIRILDLGAGTGKLTAQLAGLALDAGTPQVSAVEPDPQMLAELRRAVPEVAAMAGHAEAIPLPDASIDAVFAGQSAHWFDLDRAMPEIARVLTSGGVFAGLWNTDDDRVGWVAGLHRVTGRKNVVAFTSYRPDDSSPISTWVKGPGQGLFRSAEGAGFEHAHKRTASSLIDTMRTHSMFLIMEPAEREAVLGEVAAYLVAIPDTASGEFDFPLWTLAERTVRR
ncbi:MAG: class I SAM-dependent methyltransferase [Nocardiopsaceae bacterium]|jgi:SAM-dependent methyltransferase|nr:class I SAM-dependent methyltransferase [Nocardiopsaceae bacterium]